jgi:uroporphyrinogen-III synthase
MRVYSNGMDLTEPTPAINFLHDVSTRIAAADPLHEVLEEIIDFVTDLVSCDSCFVYVKEGNELVLRASKNAHPEALDQLKMPMGQGITGWVATNAEPVVIGEHASKDPRFRRFAELPEDWYEAFLSIPISTRTGVVGVLNVQHKDPYNFTQREIKIIATLGHLVGAAIEMSRLDDEVTELSDRLAARKVIEKAKGVLQRDLKVTEEEAYSVIQKQARQRRKSMKEISDAILLADEMKRGAK